jgi:hypothetical protein
MAYFLRLSSDGLPHLPFFCDRVGGFGAGFAADLPSMSEGGASGGRKQTRTRSPALAEISRIPLNKHAGLTTAAIIDSPAPPSPERFVEPPNLRGIVGRPGLRVLLQKALVVVGQSGAPSDAFDPSYKSRSELISINDSIGLEFAIED